MVTRRSIGTAILVAIALCGCRSGISPSVTPPSSGLALHRTSSGCTTSPGTLKVCVRVPSPNLVSSITVIDSAYGNMLGAPQTFSPSSCSPSGSGTLCVAVFTNVPETINQIEIDASYTSGSKVSGTFPAAVGILGKPAMAVLGGTVRSLSVIPFLSTTHPPDHPLGELSSLPLGQQESVWIKACANAPPCEPDGTVIIGTYSPQVSLSVHSHLDKVTGSTILKSSADAEKLNVGWHYGFLGTGKGSITAQASGVPKSVAQVSPSSGIVYFHAGRNTAAQGPGPVAIGPDRDIYFVIDDSTGCSGPGKCIGMLERFDPSTENFRTVALKNVPGISQLYFTSDGALWMSSFQPAGNWDAPLPVLRMATPETDFSESALQALPDSFGQASGFYEDTASKNLWISGCTGTLCSEDHNGTPIVVETPVTGKHSAPEHTVKLPLKCAGFGYLGFTVGDVAESGGNLYVIGLNDGSAPPAHGTIWRASPASLKTACLSGLPSNFNPSPYFAEINDTLFFGIGGNRFNVKWTPSNGFYALVKGRLANPTQGDNKPQGTATHLSATGSQIYYIANGQHDVLVYGLGTFKPIVKGITLSYNSPWSVFPSATFTGPQFDNGVAANTNGAWYTAANVCGGWNGVCLARALYLGAHLQSWSAIPKLKLQDLIVNENTNVGVLTDPQQVGADMIPLNVHSGPFAVKSLTSSTCLVNYTSPRQSLTFSLTATAAGTCLVQIEKKYTTPPEVQNLTSKITSY